MGSEWIWRAVLVTTLAFMAGLLMVFLWAYLAAADGSIAVARDRSLEPVVPMGALTMAPDAFGCHPSEVRFRPDNGCVQDYIPLVGYLFWFGPLGLAFVFAMGLAIVSYSSTASAAGSAGGGRGRTGGAASGGHAPAGSGPVTPTWPPSW